MAMEVVAAGGLSAQVRWLGLRVGGRLTLFCIRHMNRVNSRNDLMMTALTSWLLLLLYCALSLAAQCIVIGPV